MYSGLQCPDGHVGNSLALSLSSLEAEAEMQNAWSGNQKAGKEVRPAEEGRDPHEITNEAEGSSRELSRWHDSVTLIEAGPWQLCPCW